MGVGLFFILFFMTFMGVELFFMGVGLFFMGV
jgi:hypothetical protein